MSLAVDRSTVSVHTGFPNAAEDSSLQALNLNTLLVQNPISTFFFTIEGGQWENLGIFNSDIAIVDRALQPKPSDYVIYIHEGDFAINQLKLAEQEAEVWGVVTSIIHTFRSNRVRPN